jgi:hypothetical protein
MSPQCVATLRALGAGDLSAGILAAGMCVDGMALNTRS